MDGTGMWTIETIFFRQYISRKKNKEKEYFCEKKIFNRVVKYPKRELHADDVSGKL